MVIVGEFCHGANKLCAYRMALNSAADITYEYDRLMSRDTLPDPSEPRMKKASAQQAMGVQTFAMLRDGLEVGPRCTGEPCKLLDILVDRAVNLAGDPVSAHIVSAVREEQGTI